ncbi:hypothetical protein M569_09870, partial [Genlisea aurea]
ISSSYCVREMKPCIIGWVDTYFKDCLCNGRDEASFGLGILSLLLWGVAEIPQILSNFKAESSHGISLAFLIAWVLGDVFNLLGCILEPATLPTQLYTAVLYTTTTSILVMQSLYYDYFRKLFPIREQESQQEVEELKRPLKSHKPAADSAIEIPRKEAYYYASARSMAGSFTPPFRSYLWPVRSGPSTVGLRNDSSSDDDDDGGDDRAVEIPSRATASRPKPIPRSAAMGAFVGSSMSMPGKTKALMYAVGFTTRKLLQEHGSSSVTGQWLGWMMAVIYMGGRLPQIYLNIKRGNVEGLNPLMFIFAVSANSTYVASIVVRTIDWEKIKANLPWLLDAVVCVLLDLSIITQYVYYKHIRGK